ncbi:MAG: PorV/PorQ family protein [Ignavibacteriae bacterium]|nr:PorV/PorQ family protein [Ignavibacteriota bacterium]
MKRTTRTYRPRCPASAGCLTVLALAVLLGAAPVSGQLVPNLGGQRAGISAFQFLKIGVGARGVAMGESYVAVANDASSLYWNPAGMAQMTENEVFVAHTEYVADIRHEYLGAVYHLTAVDAVGLSMTSLHMQDMEITTETRPLGTGRYFSFGDVGIGLSYARKMTEQFSFGATVRYAEETLDMLKMRSFMVDLGTYYWTGLGTARFAVVITNFGADVKPDGTATQTDGGTVTDFQSFSLPTVFKLGFAFEPVMTDEHRVTTSVQLNHPNDNAENVRVGVEYAWQNTFFLRGGLKRTIGQKLLAADETSEESFMLGAGFRVATDVSTISADYAYAHFNLLGAVHRFSVTFSL